MLEGSFVHGVISWCQLPGESRTSGVVPRLYQALGNITGVELEASDSGEMFSLWLGWPEHRYCCLIPVARLPISVCFPCRSTLSRGW